MSKTRNSLFLMILLICYSSIIAQDISNATVIAKGSTTPRTEAERWATIVNIKDFGALGDYSQDDTNAFEKAIQSVSGGGKIIIPSGHYRISRELILHSGLTIEGSNNANFYYGTPSEKERPSYIYQSTPNCAVFRGGSIYNVCIRDLSLGANSWPQPVLSPPVSGKYGILLTQSSPNDAKNLVFERLTFYDFDQAIGVIDPRAGNGVSPDWNCAPVSVRNCIFLKNKIGIYFNTDNADSWVIDNCSFYIPPHGRGISINRCGFITLISCIGGGWYGNANDIVDTHWLHIFGPKRDTIKMISCQAENCSSMLNLGVGSGIDSSPDRLEHPIILDNCCVESDIILNETCHYVSIASRYTSQVWVGGQNILIDSLFDSFSGTPGVLGYQIVGAGSQINNALTSRPNAGAGLWGTVLAGKRFMVGQTPPGVGTWKVGDVVWNSAPAEGGILGWTCIAGGTPGTWAAIPIGGKTGGYRSGTGSPISNITPAFIGEEYLDTISKRWYKSCGPSSSDWKALT